MEIWAGRGNRGSQCAMHRHNIGFMAVDAIAACHGFGPVKKQFAGWTQEGRIGAHKVLLLKPATFMNESGRSLGEALRFYKLGPDALTVFHDELDLAPFKVKVKRGGGAAGHNGVGAGQLRQGGAGRPFQHAGRDCDGGTLAGGRRRRAVHERGGVAATACLIARSTGGSKRSNTADTTASVAIAPSMSERASSSALA